MLKNNWIALVVTFLIAVIWLRINDFFAKKGWIGGKLSRKIIHIGTGTLFVLCWLLFTNSPNARYLAVLVPFSITTQFVLVGTGVIKDQAAVEAMSRTGDRREILRGPLYYGIVFVLLTLVYWKNSPIGIVGLMQLCGGDGLADLIGNLYGGKQLPWSDRKTWIGSAAMFFGGFFFTITILTIYLVVGEFQGDLMDYFPFVIAISFVCTVVESLPYRDIDNFTVPITAILLGHFLFLL